MPKSAPVAACVAQPESTSHASLRLNRPSPQPRPGCADFDPWHKRSFAGSWQIDPDPYPVAAGMIAIRIRARLSRPAEFQPLPHFSGNAGNEPLPVDSAIERPFEHRAHLERDHVPTDHGHRVKS